MIQSFLMASAIIANLFFISSWLASAGIRISALNSTIVIILCNYCYLPMQKRAKISPRMSLVLISPVISPR